MSKKPGYLLPLVVRDFPDPERLVTALQGCQLPSIQMHDALYVRADEYEELEKLFEEAVEALKVGLFLVSKAPKNQVEMNNGWDRMMGVVKKAEERNADS